MDFTHWPHSRKWDRSNFRTGLYSVADQDTLCGMRSDIGRTAAADHRVYTRRRRRRDRPRNC